tara:strand:- start:272 stop:808 length:537 start_codon:yes stop_codon:yes gene_type:complete
MEKYDTRIDYLEERFNWLKESKPHLNRVKKHLAIAEELRLPLSKIAFTEREILINSDWHAGLNGGNGTNGHNVGVLEKSEKNYLAIDRLAFEEIVARWDEKIRPAGWPTVLYYVYRALNGATEYVIEKTLSAAVNNGGNVTTSDVFRRAFYINDTLLKLTENIDCICKPLKSLTYSNS